MNVRTLIFTLPTAALLALAGCAGSQASSRADDTSSTAQGMQGMAALCPMQVKDTKVEASDTDQGAALTFTTKGDVAELRRRVTAMADMHNAHHGGPGMHEHGAAGGCACGQHEGEAKACSCPGHAAGQGEGQGGSGCACGQQHEGQGCSCAGHDEKGAACACGPHEGQGGQACACGEHGEGMHKGMHMPASRATTEEVPDGIRLVLTPVDASQRDALRESVRAHAGMMSSGNCPMMKAAPAHHGG
jgi:hypothetical protein